MQKVRVEFFAVGCVLILVGLVLIVMGHAKIQSVSGLSPSGPPNLVPATGSTPEAAAANDTGYMLMGLGALLVVAGILLVAISRPPTAIPPDKILPRIF